MILHFLWYMMICEYITKMLKISTIANNASTVILIQMHLSIVVDIRISKDDSLIQKGIRRCCVQGIFSVHRKERKLCCLNQESVVASLLIHRGQSIGDQNSNVEEHICHTGISLIMLILKMASDILWHSVK